MTQPKSTRPRPTRGRPKPSTPAEPVNAAPPPPDAPVDGSSSDDSQASLLTAQAELARTIADAMQALERSSVAARTRLASTVNDLNLELLQARQVAAQEFPRRVEAAVTDAAPVQRVQDALQTLMQTTQDAGTAQAEAEREARAAYQELAAAAAGEADEDMQLRAEHAQQTYLNALRAAAPGGDIQRQVLAAHADYELALQAAQSATATAAYQAASDLADSSAAALHDRDLPDRQQSAVQEYQDRITNLVGHTQRTLLAGQVRALREMQQAWAAVESAATTAEPE